MPFDTAASAFARFTFHPDTRALDYNVRLSGVSPEVVTGLHVHRGAAGETGPHVFDLINAPFQTVTGTATLTEADVADLLAGRLYLNLHTVDHPKGAARAQLIVPGVAMDHEHEIEEGHDHAMVTPPSTGDAGLVGASAGAGKGLLLAGVGLLGLTGLGVGGLVVARRKVG
jgi:hypothetical protein